VDTSVLVAGIAGLKQSRHASNIASAQLLATWVERRHFVWLYSDDVFDEYQGVLSTKRVRRNLIGRIINMLRRKGERVTVGVPLNLSPDPDDNHICDCAEYGEADFIITLNPDDFPQDRLHARVVSPDDHILT